MTTNAEATINTEELDTILAIQILAARLGERERLGWWDMDATDAAGGGTIFKDLVGEKLGALAAAEAVLTAARLETKSKIEKDLDPNKTFTLFYPGKKTSILLNERWQQFKRHPENIPDIISQAIDPELSAAEDSLAKHTSKVKISKDDNSYGRKLSGDTNISVLDKVKAIVKEMAPFTKKNMTFCYFES